MAIFGQKGKILHVMFLQISTHFPSSYRDC